MSWFSDLSKSAQAAYIKSHPNSKYAKGGGTRSTKASGIKVEGGLQRTGVKTASKLPAGLRKGTAKPKVKKLDNSDNLSGYGRVLAIKASVRKEAGNFARRRKLYRQSKGAAW